MAPWFSRKHLPPRNASRPRIVLDCPGVFSYHIHMATRTTLRETITTRNTEQSVKLPANVRRIIVSTGGAKCVVTLSFTSGKVADGDGNQAKRGNDYDSGPIQIAAPTLYLASDTIGVTIHITVFAEN